MSGSWLPELDLDGLSPERLWACLPGEVRGGAARALYAREKGSSAVRREADRAVALAIRFREAAVRQLPAGRRAEYLARAVRPDDSLATSLLLAFHLEERRDLLVVFLDRLGVPHRDGLIDGDHELCPPAEDALRAAVAAVVERFPADRVDLYLASLLALDPETWSGLRAVLEARRAS